MTYKTRSQAAALRRAEQSGIEQVANKGFGFRAGGFGARYDFISICLQIGSRVAQLTSSLRYSTDICNRNAGNEMEIDDSSRTSAVLGKSHNGRPKRLPQQQQQQNDTRPTQQVRLKLRHSSGRNPSLEELDAVASANSKRRGSGSATPFQTRGNGFGMDIKESGAKLLVSHLNGELGPLTVSAAAVAEATRGSTVERGTGLRFARQSAATRLKVYDSDRGRGGRSEWDEMVGIERSACALMSRQRRIESYPKRSPISCLSSTAYKPTDGIPRRRKRLETCPSNDGNGRITSLFNR